MKRWVLETPFTGTVPSVGLLVFRLVFSGFMLVGHGWGKLMKFGDLSGAFPDPLGCSLPVACVSCVAFSGG